ncbi:MAG: sulfotransferase [Hyphomicrobiales bacterium]|nr:sulfotransferase [Hyphomicrobiales bacterium]
MAKSRRGRGAPIRAAIAPRFASPGLAPSLADLLPRAGPEARLESFLAKKPGSTPIPTAQAREAHHCTLEGARLFREGRAVEAIPIFERSIKLNPGVAAYHHNLGAALLFAGRLEQAIQPFAAAVSLDPNLASGHFQLAQIFDNLGHVEQAIAGFQAAVALKPDIAEAQFRLGEIYLERGRRLESAAAFRAAAAAAPKTLKARIAEARALEASGQSDEAIATVRGIVEAHPENSAAHEILGKLLGEAGLSAEAAAHHDRAAELNPLTFVSWSGLATNKKFTAGDGPLIARMNAALALPKLTPRHRQSLHFALGKAHDDLGQYELAMQNFEAGNRVRALMGRLNRDALVRRVDQLIAATPPGYRDRQPDPGVDDATPVLIVGMPRSGTTLIEQILTSHPDVGAGGELAFWGVRDTPGKDVFAISSTPQATRRLADDYLTTLRAFGPDAKRITDKAPVNFIRLGVINRVFPNATFIHCRRHPIDNALSIFTTNMDTNFAFLADRGDLVFYYRQYQRVMAHWREVLPPDRLVEVDYEALVVDPQLHARRMVAACGLEWNDACLAPHRNARTVKTASLWQARQPIYRTSVERWRRYEPWLGELRELAPDD